MRQSAYARSARVYDLIYGFKDYAAEAAKIREILEQEGVVARELLDVACGTAEHARWLVEHSTGGESRAAPAGRPDLGNPPTRPGTPPAGSASILRVDGLDLEPLFLEIARAKVPSGRFVPGDMADFDLGRQYDAVLCLFSAIGYLREDARLVSALRCFGRHLRPNGVALVEPWFTPEEWRVGAIHMQTAETSEIKVCRMNVSGREGRDAVMPFHYLVATPAGIESFQEEHRMALRTRREMLAAFRQAGLAVRFDPVGLTGRGLYVGRVTDL